MSCLEPCATCSNGVSTCTSCINGYVLAGTSCVQGCPVPGQAIVNGRCQCRVGFLFNGNCVATCPAGTGPSAFQTCANCSQFCNNCSRQATTCDQCQVGYTVDASSGRCIQAANCSVGQANAFGFCVRLCDPGTLFLDGFCVPSCPTGFIANPANTGCIPRNNGITCQVGQVVYNGRCLAFCVLGTFESNGVCLDCSSNCNTCTNSTFCVSCATGYYLAGGVCRLSPICPPPQVSLGEACVLSCPTGTYSTGSSCNRVCDDSLVLFNGWCYASCPAGLVSNTYGCVANCPAGQVIVNGVCTGNSSTGCLPGSFLSGTSCLPCQAPCATCIGLATICTSCIVGVASNGQCQNSNNGGQTLAFSIDRFTVIGGQVEVTLNVNVAIGSLTVLQTSQYFIGTVFNGIG